MAGPPLLSSPRGTWGAMTACTMACSRRLKVPDRQARSGSPRATARTAMAAWKQSKQQGARLGGLQDLGQCPLTQSPSSVSSPRLPGSPRSLSNGPGRAELHCGPAPPHRPASMRSPRESPGIRPRPRSTLRAGGSRYPTRRGKRLQQPRTATQSAKPRAKCHLARQQVLTQNRSWKVRVLPWRPKGLRGHPVPKSSCPSNPVGGSLWRKKSLQRQKRWRVAGGAVLAPATSGVQRGGRQKPRNWTGRGARRSCSGSSCKTRAVVSECGLGCG